jgi:hypothetical protein
MTMTDDMVNRLNASCYLALVDGTNDYSTAMEAADRIEALTAERDDAQADNARLREALQVYANSCDATETSPCGYEGNMCCRTARAALNTGKEPGHD